MINRFPKFTCAQTQTSGLITKIKNIIALTFAVDLRALALFRICLGLVLIHELFFMLLDYKPFFSDSGFLPVHIWKEFIRRPGEFSIHHLGGDPWIIGLLVVQILIAICFTIGFKTKTATFLTWILYASLKNRNPYLFNSGDAVILVMLFWSLFLPLNRFFSVEARRIVPPLRTLKIYNVATAAAILQMVLMYIHTGLLKDGHHWLMTFRAIDIGLSNAEFAYPLGTYLLNFPWLTKALTVQTLLVEILAPLLILLYALSWTNRTLGVLLLIGLHIGIALTMNVGHFSYVCISCLIMFLPTEFFNKITYLINKKSNPPHAPLNVSYYYLNPPATYFCGAFLVFIIIWNQWKLGHKMWEPLFPPALQTAARTLSMEQYWRMFAPNPRWTQSVYIPVAETENGQLWNLIKNEPLKDYKSYDYTENLIWKARWIKYTEGAYLKSKKKIAMETYSRYMFNNNNLMTSSTLIGYQLIEKNLIPDDSKVSQSLILIKVLTP